MTVCERWYEFWNFVEDIDHHIENGHLLYKREYELDKDLVEDYIVLNIRN